jgi:Holliday junction resolvasome RuvABC endonuclease subunit
MIIAVDPGVNGTGFAVFKEQDNGLVSAGILTSSSGWWLNRCFEICHKFDLVLTDIGIGHHVVIVEEPSVMLGSSDAYASAMRGDVVKLSMLVGMLLLRVEVYISACRIELVPVSRWKGNLPKKEVAYRVERIIGKHPYKSHAIDAIGIGLWYKGLL